MTFESCNMLNSSVASRPAYNSLQDRLLSSGVVRKELRHVEHLSVDDHPDVILLVVLRDLLGGELLRAGSGGRGCVGGLSGLCGGLFGCSGGGGGKDEGAGEEEGAEEGAGAAEEDEDAPSHEKVRLTFDWLGSIVMVVLKGAPR